MKEDLRPLRWEQQHEKDKLLQYIQEYCDECITNDELAQEIIESAELADSEDDLELLRVFYKLKPNEEYTSMDIERTVHFCRLSMRMTQPSAILTRRHVDVYLQSRRLLYRRDNVLKNENEHRNITRTMLQNLDRADDIARIVTERQLSTNAEIMAVLDEQANHSPALRSGAL